VRWMTRPQLVIGQRGVSMMPLAMEQTPTIAGTEACATITIAGAAFVGQASLPANALERGPR